MPEFPIDLMPNAEKVETIWAYSNFVDDNPGGNDSDIYYYNQFDKIMTSAIE